MFDNLRNLEEDIVNTVEWFMWVLDYPHESSTTKDFQNTVQCFYKAKETVHCLPVKKMTDGLLFTSTVVLSSSSITGDGLQGNSYIPYINKQELSTTVRKYKKTHMAISKSLWEWQPHKSYAIKLTCNALYKYLFSWNKHIIYYLQLHT